MVGSRTNCFVLCIKCIMVAWHGSILLYAKLEGLPIAKLDSNSIILPSSDLQGPIDYSHGSWFVCEAAFNYKGLPMHQTNQELSQHYDVYVPWLGCEATSITSSSPMTNPTTPSNTNLRCSKQSNTLLNPLKPPPKPTPKKKIKWMYLRYTHSTLHWRKKKKKKGNAVFMITTSMGPFVRSWSCDMGQKCGCNVYLWWVGWCRLVVLLIMWRCSGCKGGGRSFGWVWEFYRGSHEIECFSSVHLFR